MRRSVGLHERNIKLTPAELSEGDFHSLELVRALETDPEAILLDEVFAGPCARKSREILGLIAEKFQGDFKFVIVSFAFRPLDWLCTQTCSSISLNEC